MSKNLVFGFTSSKSHSLPLLFHALELQRKLLINISKFLRKKHEIKKIKNNYEHNKKLIKHFA